MGATVAVLLLLLIQLVIRWRQQVPAFCHPRVPRSLRPCAPHRLVECVHQQPWRHRPERGPQPAR